MESVVRRDGLFVTRNICKKSLGGCCFLLAAAIRKKVVEE